MAPEGSQPDCSSDETSKEKRYRECWTNLRRGTGKPERERRKAEVLPLVVAKLAEATCSFIDRSCVHDEKNSRGLYLPRHPRLDRMRSRLFRGRGALAARVEDDPDVHHLMSALSYPRHTPHGGEAHRDGRSADPEHSLP